MKKTAKATKATKATKQDWLSFSDDTIEAAIIGVVSYYLDKHGDYYEAIGELASGLNGEFERLGSKNHELILREDVIYHIEELAEIMRK